MARVFKKGKYWIGESHRYTKTGNDPVWKKIQTKKGIVKKGHGMVISKSKSKSFVVRKLRKKGYDI